MVRLMRHAFAVLLLSCAPAWAACPPSADVGEAAAAVIERLRAAPDARAAQRISGDLWRLWTRAPDERAQALLDEGMGRREAFDLPGAARALDALVAYCPDYAEGWNQRAFVAFLRGDHEAALPDLDRALALRPRHVAALSGRGLTLIALGRIVEGQDDIRAALALNPWLAERRYLSLDPLTGRPRPPQTDL